MKRLCLLCLLFTSAMLFAETEGPVAVDVPVGFGGRAAEEGPGHAVILPVWPVNLEVTPEVTQREKKADDPVDRTVELLRAIEARDLGALSMNVVFEEDFQIRDSQAFFDYLNNQYFPSGARPVILGYSQDADTYLVWVTTTADPRRHMGLTLRRPDLKFRVMTSGGQFNVIQGFLRRVDLAGAVGEGAVRLPAADTDFDLWHQLAPVIKTADESATQIEDLKKQTRLALEKAQAAGDERTVGELSLIQAGLEKPVAVCAIGSVIAVIVKDSEGQSQIVYFRKGEEEGYEPVPSPDADELGKYLLASFREKQS